MAIVADGTTFTITTGTFEVLSWDHSGISREAIDTTHLATTGGRTFLPAATYDPGELSMEVQFDASTNFPTMTQAAGTTTITLSDGSTYSGSGFVTGWQHTGTEGGKHTGEITFKFSGSLTAAAAA